MNICAYFCLGARQVSQALQKRSRLHADPCTGPSLLMSSSKSSQTANVGDLESKTIPEDDSDSLRVELHGREAVQNLPALRKWSIIVVLGSTSLCATCASSVAAFTEPGVAQEFGVSHEVTILSISLYIAGLGVGPLLIGPLSEVYGRNPVYRVSYLLFLIFTFPVAFAPNISVYLIFRFITGFCGSAFLSVVGGSASDLFSDRHVLSPMALLTISPLIGPAIGPIYSGFINQNTDWRWTYRVQIIWIAVQLLALFLFVPETYEPVLLKQKAQRLRKSTGKDYWCPLDRDNFRMRDRIIISCYRPFQLMFFDQMALLLNTWTSLILGILYLAFQAFPIIFTEIRGFTMQETGMTFIGIGIGMILAFLTHYYWKGILKREADKNGGTAPPEARLYIGEAGGILAAIGLFWIAFTTYPSVHWVVPVIGSVPFGLGIIYIYISVFTYLVTAYRPVAASAMASNSAMRSSFGAAFPLFAPAMYHKLGTVGATALLAGLTTLMTPLPFIYRRIGARLRKKSRFAVQ